MEDTYGLAVTVTIEEGIFLLGADASRKLLGDIPLEREHRVVQKFVGYLDKGSEFVGPDGNLTEGIIAFSDGAFFVHPGSGALGRNNGDLSVSGSRLDDMRQFTEDVLFLKCLNESMLEFVRYKITALGIGADLQSVHYFGTDNFLTHRVPEALSVSLALHAGLFFVRSAVHGFGGDGSARGECEVAFHSLHCLHTVDFRRIVLDLLLHLGIGFRVLFGEDAVFVASGLHECFRGVPDFVAVFNKFSNSHC